MERVLFLVFNHFLYFNNKLKLQLLVPRTISIFFYCDMDFKFDSTMILRSNTRNCACVRLKPAIGKLSNPFDLVNFDFFKSSEFHLKYICQDSFLKLVCIGEATIFFMALPLNY